MRVRELKLTYATIPGTTSGRRKINTPRDLAELVSPLLAAEACEVFMAVALDTKLHLIGIYTVSRGTLDSSLVHPREVFKAGLLANAASIITVHNHPSGDTTPSPEDRACWRRLTDAGNLLGVDCSDHMIVGVDGSYFSLLAGQKA